MHFTKIKGWLLQHGGAFTLVEKGLLYLLVLITPFYYYRWQVDGRIIDIRKSREIALYTVGIIVCTFLQKSRWFRYFVIWCVANWWLNWFLPRESYIGLTNIFAAVVLYIGLKHLLKSSLKIDIILRLIALSALFQFTWMIMQMFNYDPVFLPRTYSGDFDLGGLSLVGWSGNMCILGVFFACTSFTLLHYFKIKGKPILFFLILTSVFFLKNATTAICFTGAGLFYLFNRYRFKKKYLIIGLIIALSLTAFCVNIKSPNFDRLYIWKKLVEDGLKLRPFVGKGINFFQNLYIIDKTGTPWKEAHNDYLQMILELGIIGFVLFSGWIISRFVMFFRLVKSNKQMCIASGLVAYLIAGVSLFPMHLAQLSFYALVLLACLERTYDTHRVGTINTKKFSKKA